MQEGRDHEGRRPLRTILIPDIHEEVEKLAEVEAQIRAEDLVVCLGDYFDSFTHSEKNAQQMCEWLLTRMQDPRYTLLLGNHDSHYLWDEVGYSSGWQPSTQAMVRALPPEDRKALRDLPLSAVVEGYVVSHAGVREEMWPQQEQPLTSEAAGAWLRSQATRAKQDRYRRSHWMWSVGRRRGGSVPYGGLLWLDWDDFVDTPGVPQIVGHTPRAVYRTTGESYCLDTALRTVGIMEEGRLRVAGRTECW